MKSEANRLSEPSRRRFLSAVAHTTLGVNLLPNNLFAKNPAPIDASGAKAKNVIFLYMKGAMSHLDTLDPKTNSEIKGPTVPTATNVDGIQLSQYLPRLGQNADKMAIIRSMSSKTGAHAQGRYLMHTAHALSPGTSHPHIGPWAQYFLGKRPTPIPDSVIIGGGNPGPGFFDPNHSPFPIGDPAQGIKDILPKMGDSEFKKRIQLAEKFSHAFEKRFPHPKVNSYSKFYDQTIKFLDGESVDAFDLTKESASTRAKYGSSTFGQGCLLAARLIENGVRYVEVTMPQGWDMHGGLGQMDGHGNILDSGMAGLLEDLKDRGLLDSTMVVLCSEFGRTPKINDRGGRDHHPRVFSTVLAGGGINGGMVYGKSDERGDAPVENKVSIPDFHATIAKAMGLPLDKRIHGSGGRPFFVANRGTPIDAILA